MECLLAAAPLRAVLVLVKPDDKLSKYYLVRDPCKVDHVRIIDLIEESAPRRRFQDSEYLQRFVEDPSFKGWKVEKTAGVKIVGTFSKEVVERIANERQTVRLSGSAEENFRQSLLKRKAGSAKIIQLFQ